MKSNERLFGELRSIARRLDSARTYLADPGCNRNLGKAHLNHLKIKHSYVLTALRANRLEAIEILGRLDSASDGDVYGFAPPDWSTDQFDQVRISIQRSLL